MSLENTNGCNSSYRSADSYVIGTADYNRWLNCELNNELSYFNPQNQSGSIWQSNGDNLPKDESGGVINNFGGGNATQTPIITDAPTVPKITETLANMLNMNTQNETLIDKAKQNPLLTFGVIFGLAYIVFKK